MSLPRVTLDRDVEFALRQYTEMLARHFMADEKIKELCMKIYQHHKQAIDLIIAGPELAAFFDELGTNHTSRSPRKPSLQRFLATDASSSQWSPPSYLKLRTAWSGRPNAMLLPRQADPFDEVDHDLNFCALRALTGGVNNLVPRKPDSPQFGLVCPPGV